MARKSPHPTFDQTIELLRARSFEVEPYPAVQGGMLVSRQGTAAVLVAAEQSLAAFAVPPGLLINGEVARLLDRGYQKFIKSSQFEIPASAAQLQVIHLFTEEVKLLTGATCFFNQALGTTSDQYQYDRLKGRDTVQPVAARPWESAGRH